MSKKKTNTVFEHSFVSKMLPLKKTVLLTVWCAVMRGNPRCAIEEADLAPLTPPQG